MTDEIVIQPTKSIEPVVISGTVTTPPVSISADEHQLLADIKAAGHDLTVLFKDIIAKGESAL